MDGVVDKLQIRLTKLANKALVVMLAEFGKHIWHNIFHNALFSKVCYLLVPKAKVSSQFCNRMQRSQMEGQNIWNINIHLQNFVYPKMKRLNQATLFFFSLNVIILICLRSSLQVQNQSLGINWIVYIDYYSTKTDF